MVFLFQFFNDIHRDHFTDGGFPSLFDDGRVTVVFRVILDHDRKLCYTGKFNILLLQEASTVEM